MADENTETTVSPTVEERSCEICGEDESKGPLLLLFKCQQHYLHQECQDERDKTEHCPQCQADLRPRPASLFKILSKWALRLLVALIVVLLVSLSALSRMYTHRAEVMYEEVQAMRRTDAYFQRMVHEPTLVDSRYIGASVLSKVSNIALGCIIGWNIMRFVHYWHNA